MLRGNEQSEERHLQSRFELSRTQRGLVSVVVIGAVVIAGIGFVGSYGAVRALAERKGFGDFAVVFPIGIDSGICVLLALDLLMTRMRIPFPLLRQTAWLLTAATIAFNGAASWPDPVGTAMHAVIPLLFVVSVEAARHAVGRIADITADRHMEGVRWVRWVLSPLPTFLLWRKMILWEVRRYDDVIAAEQDRLVYQAELRMRHGWAWRWKAPVEQLLPLRIARFGVPLKPGVTLSGAGAATRAGRDLVPDAEPEEDPAPKTAGDPPAHEPPPVGGPETAARPVPAEVFDEEVAGSDGPDDEPEAQSHGTEEEAREPVPAPEHDTTAGGSEDPPTPDEQTPELEDGTPAPEEGSTDTAEVSSPASTEEDGPPVAPPAGEAGAPPAAAEEHALVLARLSSNAAAVRYAIEVLDSTHTPQIVEWLKQLGRPVNRGQAHRISEAEAANRRKSRMRMVKTGTR